MARMLTAGALLASLVVAAGTVFANPVKYQLGVDGLACPFCAYGIEKELKAAKGVQSTDIDIKTGTVTVTMAEGAALSAEEARRIVEDAGFTLRAFETLDKSAQRTEE